MHSKLISLYSRYLYKLMHLMYTIQVYSDVCCLYTLPGIWIHTLRFMWYLYFMSVEQMLVDTSLM